jgi:hypothetical protein
MSPVMESCAPITGGRANSAGEKMPQEKIVPIAERIRRVASVVRHRCLAIGCTPSENTIPDDGQFPQSPKILFFDSITRNSRKVKALYRFLPYHVLSAKKISRYFKKLFKKG